MNDKSLTVFDSCNWHVFCKGCRSLALGVVTTDIGSYGTGGFKAKGTFTSAPSKNHSFKPELSPGKPNGTAQTAVQTSGISARAGLTEEQYLMLPCCSAGVPVPCPSR